MRKINQEAEPRRACLPRHTNPPPQTSMKHANSIATLPRLEIFLTHSFKRREHFLTATRMCGFSASRCPVRGRVSAASWFLAMGRHSCSAESLIRIAKPAKINRHTELIETPVSHSKQRT